MRDLRTSGGTVLATTATLFAATILGCGGGGAKVGDCVGATTAGSGQTLPSAKVVKCGSPQAKGKLVQRTSSPRDICGALSSGPQQYGVIVGGQSFCAQ